MAIVSSKPAVVTKATRAPLRSSMVLVPTVVPWRTSSGFAGRRSAPKPSSTASDRIGRRRENLEHPELSASEIDAIGKGAAGIDRYAQSRCSRFDPIVVYCNEIAATFELCGAMRIES